MLGIRNHQVLFVRCHHQAVGTFKIVHQERQFAVGVNPIDAIEVEFQPDNTAVGLAQTIGRIGEINGTTGGTDNVVGTI
jgi:hypothetical protein